MKPKEEVGTSVSIARKVSKQVLVSIESWPLCGPRRGLDLASPPVRPLVERHLPHFPLLLPEYFI